MTKFHERLRKLRLQHGFSQKELAKLLGYSESTIKRWENRKSVPSSSYILKIATFFDVKCDYLLGLIDTND